VMERWFGITRSDARRRLEQGGVALNGKPVTALSVPSESLPGTQIKAGKAARFQGIVRRG
jgi:hypothetical protein